jgi:hypothetical protein
MKRVPMFVELCAGTAAVSLRLARSKQRAPLSRMGSKVGYADAILERLGLQAGQGADAYLWCEPDLGCRSLLASYTDRRLARAAAKIIREWVTDDVDQRALWLKLRREGPVRSIEAREVARWAFTTVRTMPQALARGATDGDYLPPVAPSGAKRWQPTAPAHRMDMLPELRAQIMPDATKLEPTVVPSGTWVYIDPPYVGSAGYESELPRSAVVSMARAWHAAGANVAISEAEPISALMEDGWHSHNLTRERAGSVRQFSKQKDEWLTLSRSPMGQLSLWQVGEGVPPVWHREAPANLDGAAVPHPAIPTDQQSSFSVSSNKECEDAR